MKLILGAVTITLVMLGVVGPNGSMVAPPGQQASSELVRASDRVDAADRGLARHTAGLELEQARYAFLKSPLGTLGL